MGSLLDPYEKIVEETELEFQIDDNWLRDIGFKQIIYPQGIRISRYYKICQYIDVRLAFIKNGSKSYWEMLIDKYKFGSVFNRTFYPKSRRDVLDIINEYNHE